MPKFVINNREVFKVAYIVEAATQEEAFQKWTEGDAGDALEDMQYVCDLNEYEEIFQPVEITQVL